MREFIHSKGEERELELANNILDRFKRDTNADRT